MLFLSVILFISAAQALERRMSYSKNPGCKRFNMSLHHVRAEGPNDTLHYFWDFTAKMRPSIFLALTDNADDVSVNCYDFMEGLPKSLNFTRRPQYEFFVVMSQLIEFNDVNDTGILTPETPRVSYDTRFFSWLSEDAVVDRDGRFVALNVVGTGYNHSGVALSGNFSVQLTAFGFENHDSELPRLLHSPNSTQCKISLEHLLSNSGFNNSRYAIDFVLVSSDHGNTSSKIITRKNLDDENSPGIFSMVDLMTPKAQHQQFRGAFLQWRPIIYTYNLPSLANSSETVAYNLTAVRSPDDTLAHSLPRAYYGHDLDSLLLERTVVSWGVAEDKFYKKSNFSSWTFLVSYGSPEEERFSLVVVLVMCIGLGLPALLILVGGTYMCARRIRGSKDELSLER